jgi:hypothetical protein
MLVKTTLRYGSTATSKLHDLEAWRRKPEWFWSRTAADEKVGKGYNSD